MNSKQLAASLERVHKALARAGYLTSLQLVKRRVRVAELEEAKALAEQAVKELEDLIAGSGGGG